MRRKKRLLLLGRLALTAECEPFVEVQALIYPKE